MEIFSLQSQDEALRPLLQQDGVQVWSAGAAIEGLPPGFEAREHGLLLVRGRLQLDPETSLDGPALAFVDAGTALALRAQDPNVRLLLWCIAAHHPAPAAAPRPPRLARRDDLDAPRTWTTGAALVHWLPVLEAPARRSLAGAPNLVLNLGHAALPLVAGAELHPLPGGAGAVAAGVVTVTLRPRSGPFLAVEQIELAP